MYYFVVLVGLGTKNHLCRECNMLCMILAVPFEVNTCLAILAQVCFPSSRPASSWFLNAMWLEATGQQRVQGVQCLKSRDRKRERHPHASGSAGQGSTYMDGNGTVLL